MPFLHTSWFARAFVTDSISISHINLQSISSNTWHTQTYTRTHTDREVYVPRAFLLCALFAHCEFASSLALGSFVPSIREMLLLFCFFGVFFSIHHSGTVCVLFSVVRMCACAYCARCTRNDLFIFLFM